MKEEENEVNLVSEEIPADIIDEIIEDDVVIPSIPKENIVSKSSPTQKAISITEFFEKNKQILGFSNLTRSLLIAVKEAVDNSLDACEDHNILPEIIIDVKRLGKNLYTLKVRDNGPGISYNNIGKVFGKLLYGSKFHIQRQRRGQQGLGISAVVLYSQITTAKPVIVITKQVEQKKARKEIISIDVKHNKPLLISSTNIKPEFEHGTELEVNLKVAYLYQGKSSLKEYLKLVHLINPHATIILNEPDGKVHKYERVVNEYGKLAEIVKLHPQGIPLGVFKRLVSESSARLEDFLNDKIYGLNDVIVKDLLSKACLYKDIITNSITIHETTILLDFLKQYNLGIPSESLALIGEKNIKAAFASDESDFNIIYTSEAVMHEGSCFKFEIGLFYGGNISKETKIQMYRAANKIPLIYQQGACMLTKQVSDLNWRKYGLSQTKDELPSGPLKLFIHICGTKVPYNSESKESLADIPPIAKLLKRSLRKVALLLYKKLKKEKLYEQQKEKEGIVKKWFPYLCELLESCLKKPKLDDIRVMAKILDNPIYQYNKEDNTIILTNSLTNITLVISQNSEQKEYFIKANERVTIPLRNDAEFKIKQANDELVHDMSEFPIYKEEMILETYISTIEDVSLRTDLIITQKFSLIIHDLYEQIKHGLIPSIFLKSRTSRNMVFVDEGYWTLSDKLTVKSAKKILGIKQLIKLVHCFLFLEEQINLHKTSTLRELYYHTERWGFAKFQKQSESDYFIENIEVITGQPREDFKIFPESKGYVAGPMIIEEQTRAGPRIVHCQKDITDGGYAIPFDLNNIKIMDCFANFIICIETSGMFKRLLENGFDSTYNCILINLEGQPTRTTKAIVKKIKQTKDIPVVVFTDCDVWSFRIYAAIAYGSIKTAHLSKKLTTPSAVFLGVKPSDIILYDLPTDKLAVPDVNGLEQLKIDPRFNTDFWKSEITTQLKLNAKSEQQSLAKYGFDYVSNIYLPEKLKELNLL